jgi:hypothetical protein
MFEVHEARPETACKGEIAMLPNAQIKTAGPAVKISGQNGNGAGNGNGRHYHRHPRFRGGHRLAAMRALAGARLVLEQGMSPAEAADWTGSNHNYITAMLTIIASGDSVLLTSVLEGKVPVLTAAAQVEGLAKLLKAYAAATADNKIAFGRTIGTESLFDAVIAPALAEADVAAQAAE